MTTLATREVASPRPWVPISHDPSTNPQRPGQPMWRGACGGPRLQLTEDYRSYGRRHNLGTSSLLECWLSPQAGPTPAQVRTQGLHPVTRTGFATPTQAQETRTVT